MRSFNTDTSNIANSIAEMLCDSDKRRGAERRKRQTGARQKKKELKTGLFAKENIEVRRKQREVPVNSGEYQTNNSSKKISIKTINTETPCEIVGGF